MRKDTLPAPAERIRAYLRTAYLRCSRLLVRPTPTRIIQLTLDGRPLLVLGNEDVGRQLTFMRRYEVRESKVLKSQLSPDDICVDIGANTGYYTVLMASQLSGGYVHAFEPDALNVHLLRANIELNEFQDRATAIQGAVGDNDAVVEFSVAEDGAYSSLRPSGRRRTRSTRQVQMKRLDTYVEREMVQRVDVLKVDVEGAEGLVFDGAMKLLSSATGPRLILAELYDPMLKMFGTTVSKLIGSLSSLGYRPCIPTESGGLRQINSLHELAGYNVFFTR